MYGCQNQQIASESLFQLLNSNLTGIDFQNTIFPNDTLNLLDFEYLYNGGGVGVGDFDNNGFPDLVFTGNMVESKIYLNKGAFQFEDITKSSGINTKSKWCTGVSIADINADGFDDIYICVGGPGKKSIFPNLLYINQGDLTFKESAAAYGLNDTNESNQAVFFDYDLDGDLDLYLLNGGGFEKSAVTVRPILKNGKSRNTDQLYQNNFNEELGHSVFTNVSEQAGINIEGFGLGVGIIDANHDHWPDIYVSNDYLSKDFLFINNQDGTFLEQANEYFGHTSHFSMGNDISDINNDGYLDIVTLDMLPESYYRRKMMFGPSKRIKFYQAVKYGYGFQYMRNMLQLGTINGFSEIGQLAGIDRTDWSWCPLIADFDNDGFQDIYITNGYGKDITDLDFVNFRKNAITQFSDRNEVRKIFLESLNSLPSITVPNYIFKNNGGHTFENYTKEWGTSLPSISNGAVYVDLDQDGDLELITNNIDQKAFIYKNNLRERDSLSAHYLQIKLIGSKNNKSGIGATVSIYMGAEKQIRYNQRVRGFQSSATDILHFGLGNYTIIDSLTIKWPDGKISTKKSIAADQLITINYDTARPSNLSEKAFAGLLQKTDKIKHHHTESIASDDFVKQPLLIHGFTNQGPCMTAGDVNGNGLEDLFIGGSYGSPASLFLQMADGEFIEKAILSENYEDTDALFFDLDGDADLDLYVTSGGSERYNGHQFYQDRIYINDGNGNFALDGTSLPELLTSTSTVRGSDFDKDGDIDLFIGGRVVPGQYPTLPQSYILQNNGGKFIDFTESFCPELKNIGMVTSAVWSDFNNDQFMDLIVVGEMMKISVFKNDGKKLTNITDRSGLENSTGMWNSIVPADLDNDGDMDYIVGNIGRNTSYEISREYPLKLHFTDFDNNGSIDPVFSIYEEGAYRQLTSLDILTKQLPALKKRILKYNAYAKSTTDDLIDLMDASGMKTLICENQASILLENLGGEQFAMRELPLMAQIAPVQDILVEDLNFDGQRDLMLIGNNFNTEVVFGRYDASKGMVLLNEGNLSFKGLNFEESGLSTTGDTRSILKLNLGRNKSLILIGKNNGPTENYLLMNENQSNI